MVAEHVVDVSGGESPPEPLQVRNDLVQLVLYGVPISGRVAEPRDGREVDYIAHEPDHVGLRGPDNLMGYGKCFVILEREVVVTENRMSLGHHPSWLWCRSLHNSAMRRASSFSRYFFQTPPPNARTRQ